MINERQWEELMEKWIPIAKVLKPIHDEGTKIGSVIRNCILNVEKLKMKTPVIVDFHPIPENFLEIKDSIAEIKNFISLFEEFAKIRCLRVNLGSGASGYRSKLLGGLNSKKLKKIPPKDKLNKIKLTHELIMKIRRIKPEESENLCDDLLNICIDTLDEKKNPLSKGLISYFIKFFAIIFPEDFVPIFKTTDLEKFLLYFTKKKGKIKNDFESRLKASFNLNFAIKNHLYKIFDKYKVEKSPTSITSFLYRFSPFLVESPKSSEAHKFLETLYNNLQKLGYLSYPIDEHAFIEIFLALQFKSDCFAKINPILDNLSFISFTEDFPDIVAVSPIGGQIYIELEYDWKRYNHEDQDSVFMNELKNQYFIVCWKKSDEKSTNPAKWGKYKDHVIIIQEHLIEKPLSIKM